MNAKILEPASGESTRERYRAGGAAQRTPARLESRRELGTSELLTFQAHEFGALTAGGMMQISGRLTPELVRRALDWLQDEHPILRAHVVKKGWGFTGSPPYLFRRVFFETAGTERIPLRSIIDPDPGAGRRMLQEELRHPIPSSGRVPRMRATLVRPSEDADTAQLITFSDHTIADVQSAMRSLDQLLRFFANPDAVPPPRGRQAPLPPALESVLPPKTDRGSPYEPLIRLPVARRPKSAIGSAVATRTLERDATETLKAQARAHRTTVHGVVAAAIFTAIHRHFGLREMSCLSSVDLRRLCKPRVPPEVYGCYVDLLRTRHRIDAPFWTIARDVANKLLTALARDHASASVLKRPTWRMILTETLPLLTNRLRADGLVLTTSGEVELGRRYGDFTLEDMTGMVSQEVMGAGFFGIAIERGGALEFMLCYAPHCLAPADAEAVADLTAAVLSHLPTEG
jgi:hypothetical protein